MLWGLGCSGGQVVGETQEVSLPTRGELVEMHDELLRGYEALDARYADWEEEGELPEAVRGHLTEMRWGYLEMQERQGYWLEAERSLKRASVGEEERYQRHQVYRDLERMREQQEVLVEVHEELMRLSHLVDPQLGEGHRRLMGEHGEYERALQGWKKRWRVEHGLDLEDEEMRDPMEETPREEEPDGTIVL